MTQEAMDAKIILRRPLSEEEADRAPRPRNVAKLLTRLQPRAPSLVPRKGSGGYRESWDVEDGVTIAGALGSVAAKGPGPRFAVTVLCLRWWPEFVFGPQVVRVASQPDELPPCAQTQAAIKAHRKRVDKREPEDKKAPKPWRVSSKLGTRSLLEPVPLVVGYGRTERVVKVKVDGKQEVVTVQRGVEKATRHRTFRPAMVPLVHFANRAFKHRIVWPAIPERLAPKIHGLIDSGLLVASLMDEYINPNECPACRGYGQDLVLKEVDGKVKAAVVDCPHCIGRGHVAWGLHRRAKAVGLRAANYKKYLSPSYNAVLGTFRDLESRAARALVRELEC